MGKIKHLHARRSGASAAWRSWMSMRSRCKDAYNNSYQYYGARGIKVCAEWRDDFNAFLSHMGECPEGYSIDRIDNDKDYEPGNCRWIPNRLQSRNRRTNKATMEIAKKIRERQHEGLSHAQLAEEYGLCKATVSHILSYRQWREPNSPPLKTNRLGADKVLEIRSLAESGMRGFEIAKRIGVRRSNVYRILSGQTYGKTV